MSETSVSKSFYTLIFVVLMVLLVVTVAIPQMCHEYFRDHHLDALSVAIAMTIAIVKAVLVVLYFMHVKQGSRLTKIIVVSCIVWLGIMFMFLLSDYMTRSWTPLSSSWNQPPDLQPVAR